MYSKYKDSFACRQIFITCTGFLGFQTFATSPSIVPVFNDDMKLILKDQNLLIDSDLLQLGELLGKGI